jgi:ribosome-binding factor A
MRREGNENEGAGYRHARLQGLILEELRALLRDDVTDPALTEVRITAVVLSVDYRHTRVHFAVRGAPDGVEQERGRVERALGRATPFLRARLADAIDLKRVPDLRFVFDGVAAPDDDGAPCSG